MGRTIGEEVLRDGAEVAFTVSRDRRTQVRHFACAACALLLWVLVASVAHVASRSNYSWVLLGPGVVSFAWLFYALSLRRVGVIVQPEHVLVRGYVSATRLRRDAVVQVTVRTEEPTGRAKLSADDEKHYLALDTSDGATTTCFFDMKHAVLLDARRRIEAALGMDVEQGPAAATPND